MSGATQLDAAGEAFISNFEGGRSADGLYHAYWDPYGHVWTIGIGETQGVHAGMVWTREQAYQDLHDRFARNFAPAINGLGVPLNQHQFNALGSFVWNLGPASMGWDVGRLLRARQYANAADAMLQYVHAGGVVLSGLVRRRQAEHDLFMRPVGPDPYQIFDTTLLSFSRRWLAAQAVLGKRHPELLKSFSGTTLRLRERDTIRRRDELGRTAVHSTDFHNHQLWILVLRTRLAWVAQREHNGWNVHNRRRRWEEMWRRTEHVA